MEDGKALEHRGPGRAGRRIERTAIRLLAAVLGVMGVLTAFISLPTGNLDGAWRWLGLLVAVTLFWLGERCFTARIR